MAEPTPIPTRCLSLAVACNLAEVREAARQLRQFLAGAQAPEADLDAWELIITEAGNNAVTHATEAGRRLKIRIEMCCHTSETELRVSDHTAGFDLPSQAELPPADSESGRGLFLIQSLADEVEYLRGRGENCMVIRKKRQPSGSGLGHEPSHAASLERQLEEKEQVLQAMTEELASCYESLSAMFRFSSALNRPQPTEEFTAVWMKELLNITEADWFAFWLTDDDNKELVASASSFHHLIGSRLSLDAGASRSALVELRAAQSRQDVWFDAITPLAPEEPVAGAVEQSNGLAHPVFVNDALVGVLVLGRVSTGTPFKAAQVNVIQAFGDFLGIQISNARFRTEFLRTQLITRELEIASNLQRSLLPETLPQIARFGLAGHYQSARQVGGDFYDAIRTDGGLLLVMADVMGKGVPAAMFAAIFRSHLRARLDLLERPGQFLTALNRGLFPDLDRMEMFITAQLVFVDVAARRIRVAGAGHCPLLVAAPGAPIAEIGNTGLPLGIVKDAEFGEELRDIPPGARLMLFTDGVTDIRNADGDLFGFDRLKARLQIVTDHRADAALTAQEIAATLQAFQGKEPAADDQTFLIVAAD